MVDLFKTIYRSRFFLELKENKRLLFFSALVMGLQAVVVVITPIPLKFLIDDVLTMKNKSPWLETLRSVYHLDNDQIFWVLVGSMILISVVNSALNYYEEITVGLTGGKIVEGLRRKMIRLLLSRTLAGLEQRRKVDILGRLSSDTLSLEAFISVGLSVLLRALPTFLFVLVSMFVMDWHFSLLIAAVLPVVYWVSSVYTGRLGSQQRAYRVDTNAFEQESYQAMEAAALLKSLGAESVVARSLSRRAEQLTDILMAGRRSQGVLDMALGGTRYFLRVVVIVLGAYAGSRWHLSLGTLVMFLSYVDALSKPLNEVAKVSSKTTKALASLERVDRIFDDLAAYPESSGPDNLTSIRTDPAEIEMDGVSFGYAKGDRLLSSFSVRFQPRTLIAVLGVSGSGKSTMTRLLNRLADPTAGAITLGGKDLRTLSLGSLRSRVVVVQQDLYLLHGTVRENLEIAAVEEKLSEARLWEALERVNAAGFVRALPRGLDTVVGEGSARFSGGEIRRLCVARAFVRAPAWIYVFDEPSSGLDPVSARIVMNSARQLVDDGALVLWVTHRVEEVHAADSVLYFRAGDNPVHSSHPDLLSAHQDYRDFFDELRAKSETSNPGVLDA